MNRSEELADVSVPQLFESDLITPATSTETVVARAVGAFNACDAWFRIPSGWPQDAMLRVYGRLNDARVLLKEVDLNVVYKTLDSVSSTLSGIAVSVRGRPVTGFEFSIHPRTSLSGTGRFSLQAWTGADGPRIIGAGDVATQPSAEETIISVRNGAVPVQAAGDSVGRVLVVGAGSMSSPNGGVLSVQGAAAGGPTYAVATPVTVKPLLTTINTTTNILTLRSSATKRVEVRRILLSFNGPSAAAAADGRIQILRAAAAPSGGNSVSPIRFDSAQASPTATALAPNPTAITFSPSDVLLSMTVRCDAKDQVVIDPDVLGQPIVLRTSQETLGIRFTNEVAVSGQTFGLQATIHFIEI